ncbi:hypothetical protein LMG9964_06316 [Paraburkholderia phenoliruptrix]|uniref:Uncharacterized protein n=2 Tax=Paraburkholderia TaxID=1822464 RepID=A0A1H7DX48_9BURK|nr:hypothetical protein LMG9964_06316 [Paraburkholderia phenoliruptrix]SEK06323.1 hypothetical protein SAMN05192539_103668 [Paraburkholderia diazotrophica]
MKTALASNVSCLKSDNHNKPNVSVEGSAHQVDFVIPYIFAPGRI